MLRKAIMWAVIIGLVVWGFTQPDQFMDVAGSIAFGLGQIAGRIATAIGNAIDSAGNAAATLIRLRV